MNKSLHNKKGFALLLAIIIAGVVLSVGLAILSVTLKQLDLGTSTVGSERAFQAAAAGMDCVRYLRNQFPDEFTNNDGTINLDCLGWTSFVMTDVLDGTSGNEEFIQMFQETRLPWDTPSGEQCLQLEVYVLNASAAGGDLNFNTISGVPLFCEDQSVCTFAYVQGYNLGCGTIANNPRAVVRELSAEF